jgi:hypothetical protein
VRPIAEDALEGDGEGIPVEAGVLTVP